MGRLYDGLVGDKQEMSGQVGEMNVLKYGDGDKTKPTITCNGHILNNLTYPIPIGDFLRYPFETRQLTNPF